MQWCNVKSNFIKEEYQCSLHINLKTGLKISKITLNTSCRKIVIFTTYILRKEDNIHKHVTTHGL